MNVMFATKDFHTQGAKLHMKEHILETNLMNVMFATNDFHTQAP
jgi:hypothetical protein